MEHNVPHPIWKALRNVDRGAEIIRCIQETPQWARVSAAYLGLSCLRYPYLLRLRLGEQIKLDELTDLKAFWQIFLRRVYPVHPTDRVILDLGANIGLFTLFAARSAPQARVFSVEPFPATFGRLVANVSQHNLDGRVKCLNFAATGADGTRVMPDASVPSQRRALASSANEGSGTGVRGKALTTLLHENDLPYVDLLKIDVEGSEYEVLLFTSRETLRRIHRIAMEYHGDCAPYSKQQLFDHLRQTGFTVMRDIRDPLGYGVTEMILNN